MKSVSFMLSDLGPILATLLIIGIGSVIGIHPIKKLIQVGEAKHELKQGSAGFLRTMSGWFIIVIWMAAIWFCATITGDWWATGDLGGAIERGWYRLELLLIILEALGDD